MSLSTKENRLLNFIPHRKNIPQYSYILINSDLIDVMIVQPK